MCELTEVRERTRDAGIVGALQLLVERAAAFEHRARLLALALLDEHVAFVLEHTRGVEAVGPVGLVPDREPALLEPCGLVELALAAIDGREVIEPVRDVGMVVAEDLRALRGGAFE